MRETTGLIVLAAGFGAAVALPYPFGALALVPGLALALLLIGE